MTTVVRTLSNQDQECSANRWQDIFANRYRIGPKIGSGSFSDVHLGTDTISDGEVAIKLEPADAKHQRLKKEACVYQALTGGVGIPSVHWSGAQDGYNAMVLDSLGPSLKAIFDKCDRKFSLKTVLLLADQLISRFEDIHAKSVIHRDIKPENFLIGKGMHCNLVHVIDFGHAKMYPNLKDIPETQDEDLRGAARYASINTHLGLEQSRRDDMESLGYVMLHFLRGSLPWQDLDAATTREKYVRIQEKKLETPIDVLCRGLPDEFATYLKHARSLNFNEKPDYSHLRGIFRDLFAREGLQYDLVFDWIKYMYMQDSPQASACKEQQSLPRGSQALLSRTAAPAPAEDNSTMIKKAETAPITHEQLAADLQQIYADVTVAEQYIEQIHSNLDKNQDWQALILLHCHLLFLHYEFFLVSQHPSATPELKSRACAMPARMWSRSIGNLLALLMERLPDTSDHLHTFTRMAYSRMACLYETVPAFTDTWMECLGDLSRCRAVLAHNDCDREVWTAVSRDWYFRVSDKAPATGRLYHHLAILARPNLQEQLFYYAKSLCVKMPFSFARKGATIWFERMMSSASKPQQTGHPPTELEFVKAHGSLFKRDKELEATMDRFLALINRNDFPAHRWLESGYHIGIANICAIMGYGDERNPIVQALEIAYPSGNGGGDTKTQQSLQSQQDDSMHSTASSETALPTVSAAEQFPNARRLFNAAYNVGCRHFVDPNALPFLHVTLVFIHYLTICPEAMTHVAPEFWEPTASMLNGLIDRSQQTLAGLLEGGEQPFHGWSEGVGAPERRLLPEDYALRGFPFIEGYYPDGWFATKERINDDDKEPWMIEERKKRIVWLACGIAKREGSKWLQVVETNGGRRFTWTSQAASGDSALEAVQALTLGEDLPAGIGH